MLITINLFYKDHKIPELIIFATTEGRPLYDPMFSSALTVSNPEITSPNTTCFPSNQGVYLKVMKN
jgi:hypothetical protein